MLTALFLSLAEQVTIFNVFRYLTLRGILTVLTALALGVALYPYTIRKLKALSVGEITRVDDVPMHTQKGGTPTMGGVVMLLAATVSTLLWANLSVRFVWIALGGMLLFGVIGFVDDYLKLSTSGKRRGFRARTKLVWQILVALAIAATLYMTATTPAQISYLLPFFKTALFDLGVWFIPISVIVLVGTSNSVNLTDGLDGLAIMPIVLLAGGLGIFCYVSGHSAFAQYLAIPYIEGAGELLVFCGSLVGAGLAFLIFNCYPAQIFMGDTGSMALGAAVAIVAIAVRQEIVLFIMGGLFVAEAISVISQVISYKLFKRRIWLMSPIHHHFELKGWPETRITVRFWIISFVLTMAGLATLKVR